MNFIIIIVDFIINNATLLTILLSLFFSFLYLYFIEKSIRKEKFMSAFLLVLSYFSALFITLGIGMFLLLLALKTEIISTNAFYPVPTSIFSLFSMKSRIEPLELKNFKNRRYCTLTKKYVLENIGIGIEISNIDELIKLDNYNLREVIYDFDTILIVEKNENLSYEEKVFLKEEIINSRKISYETRKDCLDKIREKEREKREKKDNEDFEKQKKILKNIKSSN